jgi:hypothetical protein
LSLTALLFCLLLAVGSTFALFQVALIAKGLFTSGMSNLLEICSKAGLAGSLLVILFAGGRFLRTYVADIEFWATY